MNTNILTLAEKDTFTECERIIERGQQTFVEVGLALAKIRDRKLYRTAHDTFEAYCHARWGWTRQHAGRMIEAAKVVKRLPGKCNQLVTNEGQARAIADVPEPARPAVVKAAAAAGSVTAKSITEAAEHVADAVEVHRDAIGREIPADLWPDWEQAREQATELRSMASKVKCAVEKGVNEKQPTFRELTNADIAVFENAHFTLRVLVPHALCPVCHGNKTRQDCKRCHRRGWVSEFSWETHTDKETREMIERNAKRT